MYLESIIGSMWGGKTTALYKSICAENDEQTDIFVIDWFGTRKNGRDLNELLVGENGIRNGIRLITNEMNIHYLDDALVYIKNVRTKTNVYVYIDEIHLHDVEDIREFLTAAANICFFELRIFVAGLFSDCYNSYKMFPCWDILLPLSHKVVTMCVPVGRVQCFLCGEKKQGLVVYTTADTNSQAYKNGEVIGDHYRPICFNCATEQVKRNTCPKFPKKDEEDEEDEGYGISPTGLPT